MDKGVYKYYIPLEISLSVDFWALNCHVSIDSLSSEVKGKQKTIKDYLIIEIESKLDQIDSAHEVARYSRPRLLIIFSVLSYLSNHVFDVYQVTKSEANKVSQKQGITGDVKVNKFIVDGIDKSVDLLKLLEIVTSDRDTSQLAASLLDRWRKARYLRENSEAQLFDDEAILAYFHILELLACVYQEHLYVQGKNTINQFLRDLLTNTFKLRGANLENEVDEKSKHIKALLLDYVPVKSKICFMLERLGIFNPKAQALVESLVKNRNTVAHGRHVYQDAFIWPLPPFFPIVRESVEALEYLEVLSARVISANFGLNIWKEEWEELQEDICPPIDIVKSFISERHYENISEDDFFAGKYQSVTPFSIVKYLIEKKLKLQQAEDSLANLIMNMEITDEKLAQVFLGVIIYADSANNDLSTRCRELAEETHKRDCVYYSNIKDVLRYLEYVGIHPAWFRRWIEEGRHIKV